MVVVYTAYMSTLLFPFFFKQGQSNIALNKSRSCTSGSAVALSIRLDTLFQNGGTKKHYSSAKTSVGSF